MMYHIPAVLSSQEVDDFIAQLQQAEWVDGRVTTGDLGAQVKNNQQVDTHSNLYGELQGNVLAALNRSSLFLPPRCRKRFPARCLIVISRAKLMVSTSTARYAARRREAGCAPIFPPRSFKPPESYEGGELVVNDTYGQHSVKLPAGDLVLYPSSSLHCVTPVTSGVRVASFLWVQSMIRDDKRRSMLFELDGNIQKLKSRHGESDEVLSLLNLYHNLLREWSEI